MGMNREQGAAALSFSSYSLILGTHKDGLKVYQCSFDAWDYCQAAGKPIDMPD